MSVQHLGLLCCVPHPQHVSDDSADRQPSRHPVDGSGGVNRRNNTGIRRGGAQPEIGPEPQFDTSMLGDEVVPDRSADPTELVTDHELAMIFGSDATDTVGTGDPLYVGELHVVHGLVIPAL